MAVAWSELRGIHGHSGHVEFAPDWPAEHFTIDRHGWGLTVAFSGTSDHAVGGPYAWVHLAITSALQKGLPGAGAHVTNPVTAREVNAFYRTGETTRLTAVHFWDGGRKLRAQSVSRGAGEDLSARVTRANTWPVENSLGIGLGISLQFSFDTALSGELRGQDFTVVGARALFERSAPHP
jgi:hypothetical protein